MVHGNLTPENIILNKSGAWKIMGFDFSIPSLNPSEQEVTKYFNVFFFHIDMLDHNILGFNSFTQFSCNTKGVIQT